MLRLLLFCVLFAASLGAAEHKPNIVFILADDLGYGELGCFGQKLIATPNLDRLAAEGTKFTRFYAGSPVCAPSRSVLLTGLHTGHTRVRGNAGRANRQAQNLHADDVTVAAVLKKAGYATALVGKWGVGEEGSAGVPNQQGFDYFYGYLDQLHAHNAYPEFLMRNAARVPLRNKLVPGSGPKSTVKGEEDHSGAGIAAESLDFAPDLMAAEALKWVEENKDHPFFLYWALITPHANNEGTKQGRGQEVPDLGSYAEKPWPQPDKAHAAVITRLDADVGRLLARLKDLGLDENTLVLFSSDNGHHKEGGNNPDLFDANGPLRGMKRDLTDGGIRVPTIARWPGKVRAGAEQSRLLWFADLLPTFADLAGARDAMPAKLDGLSFASLLLNVPHTPAPRGDLYWEFHEGGFSQAVLMDERWKAIRNKRLDAPVQIYDLEKDIGEEHDLAAEKSDLVARAKGLFQTARTDSPDWPIKEAPVPKSP
jgi:arylsulfatase A-like enzyme